MYLLQAKAERRFTMRIAQDRLKSPVLWMGIASIVILLMGNYGLWDAIGMSEPIFRQLVDLILVVLAGFGIVNDPTNAAGV
jgi:uncharacterized membrane protein